MFKSIALLSLVAFLSFGNAQAAQSSITKSDSMGERLQGVIYTPTGDYLVVADALANCISFYKEVKSDSYAATPSYSIKGPDSQLNYPHYLSFTTDGLYLAAANRDGDSITVYKRNMATGTYDSTPVAVISGKVSQVIAPVAVYYAPDGHSIVVANMLTNNLTLYHYQGDQYDQEPYQVIENAF